ncbi:uncharacterized protein LOC130759921 [Actinidia eriantha]|uniref:uncharacterized protein LOC130759921 n=1 Tax=Actinidia eriantha TaxID=165200 RepID=UPI002585603B|nr:uncharacterized protein LOC130759921 [Actinidia eriantha]
MTLTTEPSGIAGQQKPQLDTSIVRVTFLIFNLWARVLIDMRASHSFIALSFDVASGLEIEVLDLVLLLDILVGGRSTLRLVCRSCEVEIVDQRFVFDFIVLDITRFDVILGIDWLTGYSATIDCVWHRVIFCTPEGDHFHFVGDRDYSFNPSPTGIWRLEELNFLFLPYLVDEGSVINVVLPLVVCDFPDVFSEDLTELPPHQKIEFSIDLIPSTVPIFLPPYHFAPVELQDLKIQIQDLLDKGFTRSSASSWRASALFAKKKNGSL